jgi:hypothetical protein
VAAAFEIRSGAQWAATLFSMLISRWALASFATALKNQRRANCLTGFSRKDTGGGRKEVLACARKNLPLSLIGENARNPSLNAHRPIALRVNGIKNMPSAADTSKKMDLLIAELNQIYNKNLRRAMEDHWWAIGLMAIGVITSVAAGITGIGLQSPILSGVLGLIPGAVGLAATVFQFEGKSHWHDRKKDAVARLRRKLLFSLQDSPSNSELANVAEELSDIIERMQWEWEQEFRLNWNELKRKPTS